MDISTKLPFDRLPEPGEPAQVVWLQGMTFGADRRRAPHRHDYHELIWIRSGRGRHLIDGEPLPAEQGTVTLIGRGQVHVFEQGERLHGAVLRFGDELLAGAAQRAAPSWMLAGRGGRTVAVPAGEEGALEAVLRSLARELALPPDAQSSELQRHLISVVLLWNERWYDAECPDVDDAQVRLHRRFARLLERDFAHHHDAVHYADALRMPPAALSRALSEVTGRATKELVLDRVMLEAARLARFTDLTVGEIAHRVGYEDPLYFSRAFKRRFDESPRSYRQRTR
jgi:AraC family transcriptional activator of pobA